MKPKIKLMIISALFIFAVFSATSALTDMNKADTSDQTVECMADSVENSYVLREYGGYVAVYVENNPACPMTVTDIQVSTLRALDRQLLETGLKLASREKLMMTLEDLGS